MNSIKSYIKGERVDPPYFEGVFNNNELPLLVENPFDQKEWLETSFFTINQILATSGNRFIKANKINQYSKMKKFAWVISHMRELISGNSSLTALPPLFLVPVIPLINDIYVESGMVRILDFGGGGGDNFLQLLPALSSILPLGNKSAWAYDIIDTPNNCLLGTKLAQQWTYPCTFVSADPDHGTNFSKSTLKSSYDLVIICGTLQYIKDWQELLSQIASYNPKYIYITRTPLNERVPTFYTLQHIVPGIGPWKGIFLGDINLAIINPSEISDVLRKHHYVQDSSTLMQDYRPNVIQFPVPYNQVFYRNLTYLRD